MTETCAAEGLDELCTVADIYFAPMSLQAEFPPSLFPADVTAIMVADGGDKPRQALLRRTNGEVTYGALLQKLRAHQGRRPDALLVRARRPLRSRRSGRPPAASRPSYADPDGPARRYTDSYFCRGFDGLSDSALTLVRVLTWCAIVLATLVILGVLVWRFLNEMHTVERRLLIAECKRRKYNFHNQGLKVHLEFTPDVEAVICRRSTSGSTRNRACGAASTRRRRRGRRMTSGWRRTPASTRRVTRSPSGRKLSKVRPASR